MLSGRSGKRDHSRRNRCLSHGDQAEQRRRLVPLDAHPALLIAAQRIHTDDRTIARSSNLSLRTSAYSRCGVIRIVFGPLPTWTSATSFPLSISSTVTQSAEGLATIRYGGLVSVTAIAAGACPASRVSATSVRYGY